MKKFVLTLQVCVTIKAADADEAWAIARKGRSLVFDAKGDECPTDVLEVESEDEDGQ